MLRGIKSNSYLKKFVELCKKGYDKNLIGIGIYGSYAWGDFDKERSDYDVFLVFNHKIRDEIFFNDLKKISLQYSCSKKQLLELIREGHWSLYITLLESAKMLYHTKDYSNFIDKLRKTDFIKNLRDTKRIEWKAKFDRKVLLKNKGYDGAKYALPALRSRLQLLTYIKYGKPIWNLIKIVNLNKDFLTMKEQEYVLKLNNSVKNRKDVFPNKNIAINLLYKINKQILSLLNNK